MSRVKSWVENYEIAILTAWRGKLTNRTSKTIIPNHIKTDKEHRGNKIDTKIPFKDNEEFSTQEKKYYNKVLKASLLRLNYGLTYSHP